MLPEVWRSREPWSGGGGCGLEAEAGPSEQA